MIFLWHCSLITSNFNEFVKFYSTIQNFTLTKEVDRYLKENVFFTIGHDKKFRPIIYFFPSKIKETDIDLFRQSLTFYLLVIQKYLLKNYFIENWIFIIDLEKKGFMNFPFKAIQTTISVTSLIFNGTMHKLFLLNPTFIFYGLWKVISKFMHPDTLSKIALLKKSEFGSLLEHISKDQLIEKYGGLMKEPNTSFPLKTTFIPDERPILTADDLKDNNYIEALEETSKVKRENKIPIKKLVPQNEDWDVTLLGKN